MGAYGGFVPGQQCPYDRDVTRPFVDHIRIEDYRCVRKVDVALTRLHAFIGPNDSGKSTILSALLDGRFTGWVGDALRGDLGISWFSGQNVTEAITDRLQVTLSLVIGATLITAVIATVLGVVAATDVQPFLPRFCRQLLVVNDFLAHLSEKGDVP